MRKYRYLILVLISLILIGITAYSWKTIIPYLSDPYRLIEDLEKLDKLKGTIVLVGLCMAQVIIAVIPAGPLEIVAAYMYHPLLGTLICDIAMTLGSMFVFLFVKKFGPGFIELFVDSNKIKELKFLKNKKKIELILFLIFLLPASPKDVITYGVGLSEIDAKVWFLISFVGRIPSILLTIMSASMLGKKKFELAVLFLIIIIILYIIGIKIYKRINSVN